MKPDITLVVAWVKEAWESIPAEMVKKSFLKCGIANAMDGSEDDALYMMAMNQLLKAKLILASIVMMNTQQIWQSLRNNTMNCLVSPMMKHQFFQDFRLCRNIDYIDYGILSFYR